MVSGNRPQFLTGYQSNNARTMFGRPGTREKFVNHALEASDRRTFRVLSQHYARKPIKTWMHVVFQLFYNVYYNPKLGTGCKVERIEKLFK